MNRLGKFLITFTILLGAAFLLNQDKRLKVENYEVKNNSVNTKLLTGVDKVRPDNKHNRADTINDKADSSKQDEKLEVNFLSSTESEQKSVIDSVENVNKEVYLERIREFNQTHKPLLTYEEVNYPNKIRMLKMGDEKIDLIELCDLISGERKILCSSAIPPHFRKCYININIKKCDETMIKGEIEIITKSIDKEVELDRVSVDFVDKNLYLFFSNSLPGRLWIKNNRIYSFFNFNKASAFEKYKGLSNGNILVNKNQWIELIARIEE